MLFPPSNKLRSSGNHEDVDWRYTDASAELLLSLTSSQAAGKKLQISVRGETNERIHE